MRLSYTGLLLISLAFSQFSSAGICDPDCSKGVRQLVEDLVVLACDNAQESWSIESKAEVISSKIDTIELNITFSGDLSTVMSKLDIITDESWSIESKAEVISSKIDTIETALQPELWSIESKSEVISSKIDTIEPALQPELWSIESKAEVISSKIDTIEPVLQLELWSIESKAEVISSKIDTIEPALQPELWSIESKAEVISSKIDTIEPAMQPELWSIESKSEIISSKVDILVDHCTGACSLTPITQAITITEPGSYCLANDISGNSPSLIIESDDVTIDFNGHVAYGRVEIGNYKKYITLQNGTIDGYTSNHIDTSFCISSINCENVTLNNMILRNASDIAFDIKSSVTELLIADSTINYFSNYGVRIDYGRAVRIRQSLIYGGMPADDVTFTGTGLAMYFCRGFDIDSSIIGSCSDGVYLKDTYSGNIQNCFISNNSIVGLNLVNSRAVNILDVEVGKARPGQDPAAKRGYGILVNDGNSMNLQNCTATNYDYGYDFINSSTQFTIQNCSARANNYGFVFDKNPSGVVGYVQGCTAIQNLKGGFWDLSTGNQLADYTVRYTANAAQGNGNAPTNSTANTNYVKGDPAAGTGGGDLPWKWAGLTPTPPSYWTNIVADR